MTSDRKEYCSNYYAEHREEILAKHKSKYKNPIKEKCSCCNNPATSIFNKKFYCRDCKTKLKKILLRGNKSTGEQEKINEHSNYHKRYRKINREKLREYEKKWREKNKRKKIMQRKIK